MISKASYETLVKFRDGPIEVDDREDRIISLIDDHLIEPDETYSVDRSSPGFYYIQVIPKTWRITLLGKDVLSEYEEVMRQQSEQVRQKKSDRAFEIFLVILAYALGIFTPYIMRFVQWLPTLFVK